MAYEELRERGLVEEVRPNFAAVSTLIERARKDLATARATVSIDREWAYLIAHQAMARAARALVMAEGLRPRGRDPQRTMVQLVGIILGEVGREAVNAFDRMRRKSQVLLEEPGTPVSRYEAEGALREAQRFLQFTVDVARDRNPQLALP
jgi:HEPN domain-containing protein